MSDTIQVENEVKPIFIGSKVCSKKTGFPGVGIVVAVEMAMYFCSKQALRFGQTTEQAIEDCKTWHRLYPYWINKVICIVFYKEQRKACTLEEIQQSCPDKTEFEIQEMFNNLPLVSVIGYPIDDLEVVE